MQAVWGNVEAHGHGVMPALSSVGRPVKHPWQGGIELVEKIHQPLPPVSYPMA